MEKKIDRYKPGLTFNGEPYPFKDYLVDIGGSGQLYDDFILDVLNEWKTADWAYVDDFIGHLAAHVLIDAAETDREIYNEIMTLVEKAYLKFRQRQRDEYKEDVVTIRREAFYVVKNEKSPSDEDDNIT